MKEKRRERRLKEDNEVIITVFADGVRFPKEQVVIDHCTDISLLGARIRSNVYLPINSFIKTELKLKKMFPVITTIGKVKWIKSIMDKNYFEAGVEFFAPSPDVNKRLADYVSWLSSTQPEVTRG